MKSLFEEHPQELEPAEIPQQMPALDTPEPPAAPEPALDAPEAQELPEDLALPDPLAPMEVLDELYPVRLPPKKRVRPELILGLLAILAAGVLAATVVLCMPYFSQSEDPEEVIHRDYDAPVELPMPSVVPEASEPEDTAEETENPTIPPDPNPYDQYDFQFNSNNYLLLQNLPSIPGVDVSAHQGAIDWKAVARSGIQFAMVRLGYRGYGSGKLVVDDYVEENLRGASKAGLKLGAYFFSQALTIQEAHEEIEFMLEILGDRKLDMPIVLDWEIPAGDARTVNMDARTLTDIQMYFIEVMRSKGYTPMVYFNWHQSENLYYLSELESAPFWLALYKYRMNYPWKVEMWQYTSQGRVPGILGDVDLNVWMPD